MASPLLGPHDSASLQMRELPSFLACHLCAGVSMNRCCSRAGAAGCLPLHQRKARIERKKERESKRAELEERHPESAWGDICRSRTGDSVSLSLDLTVLSKPCVLFRGCKGAGVKEAVFGTFDDRMILSR